MLTAIVEMMIPQMSAEYTPFISATPKLDCDTARELLMNDSKNGREKGFGLMVPSFYNLGPCRGDPEF